MYIQRPKDEEEIFRNKNINFIYIKRGKEREMCIHLYRYYMRFWRTNEYRLKYDEREKNNKNKVQKYHLKTHRMKKMKEKKINS